MVIPRDKRKHTEKTNMLFIIQRALIDSIYQLNPFKVFKNPIIFVVEICLILMFFLTINPALLGTSSLSREINFVIFILLLLTVLFSNFAENLAKHITKAQAENLRVIHSDIEVKKILPNGLTEYVFASQLEKGNIIKVQEGDLIPLDGEVIEGIATVDESAITGESSPVLKEPGTDVSSSVTGGSRILTDKLLIKITSEQGQTYFDQMVNLAEGMERHKTSNELSLTSLLIASSITFLLIISTLPAIMTYLNIKIEIPYLIVLLVCLLPTTIASLVIPIRIVGFKKLNNLNIVATSEKSVETAGDINILFLDKTGTITFGNRMAIEFIPLGNNSLSDVVQAAYLASFYDQTPEGRSILLLAKRYGVDIDMTNTRGTSHEFTAYTRMSGIDLESGEILRKGASDAVKKFVLSKNGTVHPNTDLLVENIARQGGTPLLIAKNNEIIGTIHLKDLVKASIEKRFKELDTFGIKPVLCTGDNKLTAQVIANEVGIDEHIALAKPEDKIHLIRNYQSKGMVVAMTGDGTNDAPALAQADLGIAMNSGTVAAKEASNMIDMDSDPSKIIEIVSIGKQLLTTRGALTTFAIINDISKYFAILPSIFTVKGLEILNIMHLESGTSAILSALIFNTLIIPLTIPIALKGVPVDQKPDLLLRNNLLKFGIGGLIIPFIAIKLIDLVIGRLI